MVPDGIRQFFAAYRDAFVRFDGTSVAASYHAPCILARGDAYALWATPAEVQANCEALVDGYRQRGTERAAFEFSAFQPQGPHFAVVTLDWTIYARQTADPLSFHATYNRFK